MSARYPFRISPGSALHIFRCSAQKGLTSDFTFIEFVLVLLISVGRGSRVSVDFSCVANLNSKKKSFARIHESKPTTDAL